MEKLALLEAVLHRDLDAMAGFRLLVSAHEPHNLSWITHWLRAVAFDPALFHERKTTSRQLVNWGGLPNHDTSIHWTCVYDWEIFAVSTQRSV